MEIVEEKKRVNIIKEVLIFAIVFGIILGVLAYFQFTTKNKTPMFAGMRWSTFLGLCMAFISFGFICSALLLAATRSILSVILIMLSGIMFGVFYFIFELFSVGVFSTAPIGLLFYAIPFIIIQRSVKAIAYINNTRENTSQNN